MCSEGSEELRNSIGEEREPCKKMQKQPQESEHHLSLTKHFFSYKVWSKSPQDSEVLAQNTDLVLLPLE